MTDEEYETERKVFRVTCEPYNHRLATMKQSKHSGQWLARLDAAHVTGMGRL